MSLQLDMLHMVNNYLKILTNYDAKDLLIKKFESEKFDLYENKTGLMTPADHPNVF